MTTYGTIPSSSSPAGAATKLPLISRAKETLVAGLGVRRPWGEIFDLSFFNPPNSFAEALSRVQTNAGYFRMNYAVFVLTIVFVSLIWDPVPLVAFVAVVAFVFLLFLRCNPLVVFGLTITDGTVLPVLAVAAVVALLLTGAIANIVWALSLGVAAVLIHGSMRESTNLVGGRQRLVVVR